MASWVSPMGLAADGSLVEVKCPWNLLYVTIDLTKHYKRKGLFALVRKGRLNTQYNHQACKYYTQCQKYLHLLPSAKVVHFGIWAPKTKDKILVIDILPDVKWMARHKRHGLHTKQASESQVHKEDKQRPLCAQVEKEGWCHVMGTNGREKTETPFEARKQKERQQQREAEEGKKRCIRAHFAPTTNGGSELGK